MKSDLLGLLISVWKLDCNHLATLLITIPEKVPQFFSQVPRRLKPPKECTFQGGMSSETWRNL